MGGGLGAKPLGFEMYKLFLSLILFSGFIYPQYEKNEYPINLNYTFNKAFNLRISVSRNCDLEGSDVIFFEMPSLSFTILENQYNKGEYFYSVNPLIWLISTITNSGEMKNSGGGMPILNLFLVGIPNTKFEITLYKKNYLVFGLDLDYLVSSKSVGIRGAYTIGLKTQYDCISAKLLFTEEGYGFASYYKSISYKALRIDLSYNLGSNSISEYIYHCGAVD